MARRHRPRHPPQNERINRELNSPVIHGLLHSSLRGAPREKAASVTEARDFLDKVLSLSFHANTIRERMKDIDEIILDLQREIDNAAKEHQADKRRN